MDPFFFLIDLVLHFDNYLPGIIDTYGLWTYLILFAIIFCETGFVVMPYLPGDSLLFVAGALAGTGYLNVELLIITLTLAAILGDTVNYWIGHTVGMKLLDKNYCFIKQDQLHKTEDFFTRYGGMIIVQRNRGGIMDLCIPSRRIFLWQYSGHQGKFHVHHLCDHSLVAVCCCINSDRRVPHGAHLFSG